MITLATPKSVLKTDRPNNLPVHYHPSLHPHHLSHNPRPHGHACDGGDGALGGWREAFV